MRSSILLLFWISVAAAQVVPDVYIVELQSSPAAAFASKDNRRAVASDRLANINAEQATVRRAIEGQQAQVIGDVDMVANALIVRVPDALAAGLSSVPGVARVYPVVEMRLELDRVQVIHKVTDAIQRIGGARAAGEGIKIGIIDTGIDITHPGFQDNTLAELPGYPRAIRESDLRHTNRKVIVARRYSDEPGDSADPEGHGTAVAMAAAGVPHQAPFGFISGVAPRAYLGNYSVADGSGGLLNSAGVLKALDDAVLDGMDVINMSLGSEPVMRIEDDPLVQAIERAAAIGVIVVKSAGNSGPNPNTLTSPGTAPSGITVAASSSDRSIGSAVSVGNLRFAALPGNGPSPADSVTGKLVPVSSVDTSELACGPFPSGSLAGVIALIQRGECNFSVKLNNAQQAGAIAALICSDAARPGPDLMNVEGATLPAMMVSHSDGVRIKELLAGGEPRTVTLFFLGGAVPIDANRIAPFSSRGPTGESAIKPDISAVGLAVYTAAQSTRPSGAVYDASGYLQVNGTSFASPIVAGAVAILRSVRPGLTAAQYSSLIVNSAAAFPVGSTQQVGSGLLDVDAAIRSTIVAAPVSISFGAGSGTIDSWKELRITNVSAFPETYSLTVEPIGPVGPRVTLNRLDILPGGTELLHLHWNASDLPPGEYQGFVRVRGARTEVDARIPYWYAVRSGTPRFVTLIQPPDSERTGETVRVFARVTDGVGLPLFDPELRVTAETGGGEVLSTESIDTIFPGVYRVRLRMGPDASTHTFLFESGDVRTRLAISVAP
jgi:subtilisin family serine protease